MDQLTSSDLDDLLEKWFEAKKELQRIEAKCDKFKKYAEKIMNSKQVDTISSDYFNLKRKEIKRGTIGKKDIPKNIWDQYSKNSIYTSYYLTEK